MRPRVAAAHRRVAPLEEELRRLKEDLWAAVYERDESRSQATEASLHANSLARDLEAQRSVVTYLRAHVGSNCDRLILFRVSSSHILVFLFSSRAREGPGYFYLDLSDALPGRGPEDS